MVYKITKYTRDKANKLGVVYSSTNKAKKIASIGGYGMNDYPTYIIKKGIDYVKERRRLYRIRHENKMDPFQKTLFL